MNAARTNLKIGERRQNREKADEKAQIIHNVNEHHKEVVVALSASAAILGQVPTWMPPAWMTQTSFTTSIGD